MGGVREWKERGIHCEQAVQGECARMAGQDRGSEAPCKDFDKGSPGTTMS